MDEPLVVISASMPRKLGWVWWGLDPRVRFDGGLSGGGRSGFFVAGTVTGTVVRTAGGVGSDILRFKRNNNENGTRDNSKSQAIVERAVIHDVSRHLNAKLM
jgi:hypothetical protein